MSESSLLYTFRIFKSNRLAVLVFITSVNSVLSRARNGFINKQPIRRRAVFIDTGKGRAGEPGSSVRGLPSMLGNALVFVYTDGEEAGVDAEAEAEPREPPAASTRRDGRYIHPATDTLIFFANTSTVEATVRWMHYKDMQMVHSINRQATERFFFQSVQCTVLACCA